MLIQRFMSSRNFEKPIKIHGRRKVITKKMIEDAQAVTKSNAEASRWLGINYLTYRKYAKIYGLFDQHLNQRGVGIKKGYGKYRKPLDELLSSDRKIRLTKRYLKKRLVEENWVEEECSSCSYNEIVMGKDNVALLIDFIDGDNDNTKLDNIRLLCPNCYLSYNGHMPSSGQFYK
jgi:hypothetical protein